MCLYDVFQVSGKCFMHLLPGRRHCWYGPDPLFVHLSEDCSHFLHFFEWLEVNSFCWIIRLTNTGHFSFVLCSSTIQPIKSNRLFQSHFRCCAWYVCATIYPSVCLSVKLAVSADFSRRSLNKLVMIWVDKLLGPAFLQGPNVCHVHEPVTVSIYCICCKSDRS